MVSQTASELSSKAKNALFSPDPPVVVFQSKASYHPLCWLLIALAPASTVIGLWFVVHDATAALPEEEKARQIKVLIGTTAALVVVFALVLPRRFEVVSDASINVVTCIACKKWNFANVCAAYDKQSIWSEWSRPKFKFAVNFENRVVVRRKNGGWDVLISPTDPKGFVDAVWKVVNMKENDEILEETK